MLWLKSSCDPAGRQGGPLGTGPQGRGPPQQEPAQKDRPSSWHEWPWSHLNKYVAPTRGYESSLHW